MNVCPRVYQSVCVCVCVCAREGAPTSVYTFRDKAAPPRTPAVVRCGLRAGGRAAVLINRGAVQQDCTVINWAQDLICSVLMKMKRGSGVVPPEQRGG